jgi:hypothetical protein
VAALSTQLVGIASALSPTSASMLLDQGYSMVVPVLPESIYEHTLAARPNFRERCGSSARWVSPSLPSDKSSTCLPAPQPLQLLLAEAIKRKASLLRSIMAPTVTAPAPPPVRSEKPGKSYMFLVVNGALLLSLVGVGHAPFDCDAAGGPVCVQP